MVASRDDEAAIAAPADGPSEAPRPRAPVVAAASSPRDPGLVQRRVGAIQRSRILTAAMQTVSDEGAAALTVTGIVERAGVSRRTFYEAFPDVRSCLTALVEEQLAVLERRVLPAYDAASGWRERIRAGLGELLLYLDEQPDAAKLLMVEWPNAGPAALDRRRRVLEHAIAAVGEGAGGEDAPAPAILAEGIVGGVLAILHRRIYESGSDGKLAALTSPLMATIVLPYLGRAAARAELAEPAPHARRASAKRVTSPLPRIDMRLTQRTTGVIATIAATPGMSNRAISDAVGVIDQGQISKLLLRLQRLGLIENATSDSNRQGAANAWTLTPAGKLLAESLRIGPEG